MFSHVVLSVITAPMRSRQRTKAGKWQRIARLAHQHYHRPLGRYTRRDDRPGRDLAGHRQRQDAVDLGHRITLGTNPRKDRAPGRRHGHQRQAGGACPGDAPELPSTASDCRQQLPATMKLARPLNPPATPGNALVMRSSLSGDRRWSSRSTACAYGRRPREGIGYPIGAIPLQGHPREARAVLAGWSAHLR